MEADTSQSAQTVCNAQKMLAMEQHHDRSHLRWLLRQPARWTAVIGRSTKPDFERKCAYFTLCCGEHDGTVLSVAAVQGVWREVTLSSLTTLLDLPFLDVMLAEDGFSRRQRRQHNFIISNIVAKNWHLRITASLVDLQNCGTEWYCPDDAVLRAAIACVECLPKGLDCVCGR